MQLIILKYGMVVENHDMRTTTIIRVMAAVLESWMAEGQYENAIPNPNLVIVAHSRFSGHHRNKSREMIDG